MLNLDKMVELDDVSVEDMIDILRHYPPDYTIKIDGNRYGHVHVNDEDKQVIIDSSSRPDEYDY